MFFKKKIEEIKEIERGLKDRLYDLKKDLESHLQRINDLEDRLFKFEYPMGKVFFQNVRGQFNGHYYYTEVLYKFKGVLYELFLYNNEHEETSRELKEFSLKNSTLIIRMKDNRLRRFEFDFDNKKFLELNVEMEKLDLSTFEFKDIEIERLK